MKMYNILNRIQETYHSYKGKAADIAAVAFACAAVAVVTHSQSNNQPVQAQPRYVPTATPVGQAPTPTPTPVPFMIDGQEINSFNELEEVCLGREVAHTLEWSIQ